MTARRGTAQCGHPGTYVTNTYITCDQRCEMGDPEESDGIVDLDLDDVITQPLCSHCGSDDLDIYPGFCLSGKNLWHCRTCQRSTTA